MKIDSIQPVGTNSQSFVLPLSSTFLLTKNARYQEAEKIEGLTMFDLERKPRTKVNPFYLRPSPFPTHICWCPFLTTQITESRTQTLSTRSLNADLTCPICLGILQNTHIVAEVGLI
jgi:hypothetical protein